MPQALVVIPTLLSGLAPIFSAASMLGLTGAAGIIANFAVALSSESAVIGIGVNLKAGKVAR